VRRTLKKIFITTASISDALMYLSLERQGLRKIFKDFQTWERCNLPLMASTTKGGLNKSFVPSPSLHDNVDQYDISGAYATAMSIIKLPLSKPVIQGYKKENITKFCNYLNTPGVLYCLANVSFQLPDNTSEWERPLVIYDNKKKIGFTGTKTDEDQWFTMYELLTLGTIHPNLEIEIHSAYIWEEAKTVAPIDIAPLYNSYKTLRKNYKKMGEAGDAMQNTIKLIDNGGYGKTLQNKAVYNPTCLHNNILTNTPIYPDLHKTMSTSKVYSSIWGNAITSLVRCVVAITAFKNKAQMAVTDSIFCKKNTFIPTHKIETPFSKLTELFQQFTWEKEQSDVTLMLFKERDYFCFQVLPEKKKELIEKLLSNEASTDCLKDMKITKAAKRGFKGSAQTKPEKYNEFAGKCLNRLNGMPIFFTEKKLVKIKEFLLNGKVLNSIETQDKSLGGDNIRFMCNTLEELDLRIRIKEKCRQKGFADALHAKIQNREVYNKIVNKTKPTKVQPQAKLTLEVKEAIFELLKQQVSFRNLEKFLKNNNILISKSTLHRWFVSSSNDVLFSGSKKEIALPDDISNYILSDNMEYQKEHPFHILWNYLTRTSEKYNKCFDKDL
jgi:hypothetical protein